MNIIFRIQAKCTDTDEGLPYPNDYPRKKRCLKKITIPSKTKSNLQAKLKMDKCTSPKHLHR